MMTMPWDSKKANQALAKVNKNATLPDDDSANMDSFHCDESSDHGDHDDEEAGTGSTTGPPTGHSEEVDSLHLHPEGRLRSILFKTESRFVNMSRMFFLGVLFLAAAIVATCTYMYLSREEYAEFKAEFEDYANEIIKVSEVNTRHLINSYKTISVDMTSQAISNQAKWPFITVPLFTTITQHVVKELKAKYLSVQPFVTEDDRLAWEEYSVQNQWWINESLQLQGMDSSNNVSITPYINRLNYTDFQSYRDDVPPNPYYAPVWQVAPVGPDTPRYTNYNAFQSPSFNALYKSVVETNDAVISKVLDLSSYTENNRDVWPQSTLAQPVYDKVGDDAKLVALITSYLPWNIYFENILSEGVEGLILVVRNLCQQEFSYIVMGGDVEYLGPGDFHSSEYDGLEVAEFNTVWKVAEGCDVSLHLYPTKEFQDTYQTDQPLFATLAVIFIFVLTACAFVLYDCFVEKRQDKVLTTAVRSGEIVDSFLPRHVRDRVMQNGIGLNLDDTKKYARPSDMLNASSVHGVVPYSVRMGKPIADLHPHATVMVADIANFTAWASVREPSQVFILLETIYASFDKIARRRRVFKVETIADTYVAVCGLPKANKDHAVIMARFAHSCVSQMGNVVCGLEVLLGPETGDLQLRVGLHSGQVTAGVLRGERSRFQLIGETVSTATFLEDRGAENKVHMSEETATLLRSAGKSSWIQARKDLVSSKRNGTVQTYWLKDLSDLEPMTAHSLHSNLLPKPRAVSSTQRTESSGSALEDKKSRLISWHVEILSQFLKQIIVTREASCSALPALDVDQLKTDSHDHITVLEEVKEIITLPKEMVTAHQARSQRDPDSISLSDTVTSQLVSYIQLIAEMYRDNHFHNFEHASHVAQSLNKFLSRVVTPDQIDYEGMCYVKKEAAVLGGASSLHTFTYGITSDPLTQFACAFSALIHDVDHRGIPNSRLMQEEQDLAELYKKKSIAEQNSVDLAWELLMEPEYKELRATIYSTQEELDRFRQLVVNSVMATDIVDKELGALRKKRWMKAFHPPPQPPSPPQEDDQGLPVESAPPIGAPASASSSSHDDDNDDDEDNVNRKATIVIEHLIQAADVAHTMQHWHVYLKWNERFFQELYQTYLDGRSSDGTNPADKWYEGEIGFFDFYIIPLAKKLNDCGVFGVSSDECLSYALANRREWELKGKDIIQQYLNRFHNNTTKKKSPSPKLVTRKNSIQK